MCIIYFKMNERIIQFILSQTVAHICCIDEQHNPYCFSCFYAFDKENELLYFKSSAKTHHIPILLQNPVIAGTIQPDKLNRMAIKGIQFTGRILSSDHPLSIEASSAYHKEYPFAYAMKGEVWALQLDWVKMTDNTLAFGKKIIWERATNSSELVP